MERRPTGGSEPAAAEAVERRLTRRVSIEGALVEVAHEDRKGAVFGIDLNADGMRIVAPVLGRGERVKLTFQLDETKRWTAVGARVVHAGESFAGLAFEGWEDEDRLRLLEYLADRFEEA